LNIPATAFLSGGRDARPPRNAHFQREKAVPGSAHLLIGVVKYLTQKVKEPKPFSRHNTRTKNSFSVLNCGFQDEKTQKPLLFRTTLSQNQRKLRRSFPVQKIDAGTNVLTTKGTKDTKNAVFECFVSFVVYILVAVSLRQVVRAFRG